MACCRHRTVKLYLPGPGGTPVIPEPEPPTIPEPGPPEPPPPPTIFYPTEQTFFLAPGAGIRGTWSDPNYAIDRDLDTYASELVNGSSPLANWSTLHLHNWEPFDTTGLVSVDVSFTVQYLHNGNSPTVGPMMDVAMFGALDGNWIHPGHRFMYTSMSADLAKTTYTHTMTAAQWNALAYPTFRFLLWHSLSQSFSPQVEGRLYGAQAEPHY